MQDPDIQSMSQAQLRQTVISLRKAIRKHRDSDENARCWHNDLDLYACLPEEKPAGKMVGDEKTLLQNCKRYIKRQQCHKNHCPKQ